MLIRNITDKTLHPKSLSLTSEIRLAPGEAVDSEKLTKHPGWTSIEPLIGMGLLAYEEAPPKPAPKKAAPKKAAPKKTIEVKEEAPVPKEESTPKRPPRRRKKS